MGINHQWLMSGPWEKPIENSIDALRHGMTEFDGVEFDMRLTMDGKLVLFHNNHLSKAQVEQIGGSKWTEDHTADELAEVGIQTFEQLLSDEVFTHSWREHGKVACVELKMPHPNSKIAGSVKPKKREKHARAMTKLTDSMLNEVGLHQSNVVLISFKRKFRHTCARANVRWPVAQLKPAIPEIGGRKMKRVLTLPSFMSVSYTHLRAHET